MKKYRIVEHCRYDGSLWWSVERKVLWFWVCMRPYSNETVMFDTLEEAEKFLKYLAYGCTGGKVVKTLEVPPLTDVNFDAHQPSDSMG